MTQFPDGGTENTGDDTPDEVIETIAPDLDALSDEDESARVAVVDPAIAAIGIETFADLPLHERVLDAVQKIGWATPTPVQKLCLPFTLKGRDVAGFAQTGTGKTGVFLITIINRLLEVQAAGSAERVPRAIVLCPTRELAIQIEQDAQPILEHTGIKSIAVYGGIDYDKQAREIRDGIDVIVATPGRLMDYIKKGIVKLEAISVFVCDEADRMFDMGFIEDVEFFLERIPETSQKMLFSATTNEQVKELAFEYLETPEYISVNPEVLTAENLVQHAIHVHAKDKLKVMLGLLEEHKPECSIIFTNTKLTAAWLHYKLAGNGIDADLITGDLPQKKRIQLIQRIKEGKLKALIATDVASRGLHISRVTHVYNFDLPEEPANYVHRIGRTARAGASGASYSLVCDDYGHNLAPINEMLVSSKIELHSEWFDPKFLEIQDKAGDPFEGRYRSSLIGGRSMSGGGGGGGSRGSFDRGGRGGGDRGGRGGGGGGGGDRDRGGRGGGGGGDRDRGGRGDGPRHGGGGGRHDGPRHQGGGQQAQGRHGGGGHQGQQGQGQQGEGGGRKRRRRRGRGRGGEGQQQDRQDGQRSQHDSQYKSRSAEALDGTPNTFGGMIKKFFKTLLGRK
jgi:ATP-dependent RNA helicase RhlB